jgi:O-antigen/teichoic acid export membrane protein
VKAVRPPRALSPVSSAGRRFLGDLSRSTIMRSASALYSSTIITSGLGFVFWAFTARLATDTEVGQAGAAISLMQLVGAFATLGLGSLLIAELGRHPERTVPLVSGALALCGAFAVVSALIVGTVVGRITDASGELLQSAQGLVLFSVGCAAYAVCTVLDYALVGAQLSSRQVVRNAFASVVKLAALPVLAATMGMSADGIYLAWTLGLVLSILAVLQRSSSPKRWLTSAPDPRALAGLGWQAAGHHAINISGQASGLVLPTIVAGALGPATNALFFMAMQIAGFVWAIPLHVSTALFAVSAADRSRMRQELRTALQLSTAITLLAVAGAAVLGPFVLRVFGPSYVDAAPALVVLMAVTLPTAVMVLYVSVCRVDGRLGRAAIVLLIESAGQLVGGTIGAQFGLVWVAVGILVPSVITAVLVAPSIRRSAREPVEGPGVAPQDIVLDVTEGPIGGSPS